MQFHELTTVKSKNRKRVGRGTASGYGKTAGRGTKGQNSRSGGGVRPGFEGGQNPLTQRLPKKKGFISRKTAPTVIYTGQLDKITGAAITNPVLANAGLIENEFVSVKIISKGTISKAKKVEVALASASAITAIEKAGGSFKKTEPAKRESKKQKTDKKSK